MNEQKPPNAIEWTRPYGRRGFTWNVVSGCMHDCRWLMPDGSVAICYAKTVAERVAQHAYPHGFEHHYFHPDRLNEPLKQKEGAGIFLDSMADLMGANVPAEQIEQVLDVCRRAEQHIFFLLTKNAPRLAKFKFPRNVWVGASSPPDWMHGKRLDRNQQARMLETTLRILSEVNASVKWISFEPLSWNVSRIIQAAGKVLDWSVIGAASNGKQEFPPDMHNLIDLLDVLDAQRVPVFYKGNLRSLEFAARNWREAFPPEHRADPVRTKQLSMFGGGL